MTAITKEMLKDLKSANTLCIHHNDGQTFIRCLFKGEFKGKQVEAEKRYDLDSSSNVGSYKQTDFEAFVMLDYIQHAGDETMSQLEALRVNDEIKIHWYADYGTNGYVFAASGKRGDANSKHETKMTEEEKEAAKHEYGYGLHEGFNGLHADACQLLVTRGDKKRMTFTLDWSVCPDNTARMIRKKAEPTYAFKIA